MTKKTMTLKSVTGKLNLEELCDSQKESYFNSSQRNRLQIFHAVSGIAWN